MIETFETVFMFKERIAFKSFIYSPGVFSFIQLFIYYLFDTFSALTRFGVRKSIWPVSDEVFCGCLSGMKCRLFVYGPADTTAFPKTPSSLLSFKSCLSDGLPFWYRITQVVHEKGWWRGSVVERRSLAGELSLSCARPAADG